MDVVEQILKYLDLGAAQQVRRTRKRPFRKAYTQQVRRIRKRPFRKAYMARGMGKIRMQDFEFVRDALGHPSPTTMEIIQKTKVIEGMPKFA